jgi:hypothetical protein
MGTIRTVEERMPPGFRFHPRDDELVLDYLLHKLSGRGHGRCGVAMADVDLNKCEPWDLPGLSVNTSFFVVYLLSNLKNRTRTEASLLCSGTDGTRAGEKKKKLIERTERELEKQKLIFRTGGHQCVRPT